MTEFTMLGEFYGLGKDKKSSFIIRVEDGVEHLVYTNSYVISKLVDYQIKIGVGIKVKGHITPDNQLFVDKAFIML